MRLAAANPVVETLDEELAAPRRFGLGPPQALAAFCLCGVFAFLNLYVTQPMLPLFERLFHVS